MDDLCYRDSAEKTAGLANLNISENITDNNRENFVEGKYIDD